jgi:hypothetical protein
MKKEVNTAQRKIKRKKHTHKNIEKTKYSHGRYHADRGMVITMQIWLGITNTPALYILYT